MDVQEPEEEQDKLGLPRGHLLYINIEWSPEEANELKVGDFGEGNAGTGSRER